MKTTDLDHAVVWLRRHGFVDAVPTPLLNARLAVRRRTRLGSSMMLAGTVIAAALVYKHGRPEAPPGFGSYGLAVLVLAMVGLVAARHLLDWWVRRTDRRWGETLLRRATYPVRLGWRTVVGLPRAAVTVTAFLGAMALAVRALSAPAGAARYAAFVLLIAVGGTAIAMLVQVRHVLTRPVVADDERSLDADLVMRIEDAQDAVTPTLFWAMPISSVIGIDLGWWNDAWFVFVVLGVIALAAMSFPSVCRGTTTRNAARQAAGVTLSR